MAYIAQSTKHLECGVESMVEKNKLLSDLLDEECHSSDLDDLLESDDLKESWFRYHTVSAIIKDQHSANASLDFCNQISAKIAEEPAILAAPKSKQPITQKSNVIPFVAEFKRTSGGFAIAASVAVATFFSFQTIQVAQEDVATEAQIASQSNELNNSRDVVESTPTAAGYEIDATEQFELDIFNDRYIQDLRRSDKGSFAPVSGEFVRTVRFSAEEWQAILEKSLERQRQLEKTKLEQDKE